MTNVKYVVNFCNDFISIDKIDNDLIEEIVLSRLPQGGIAKQKVIDTFNYLASRKEAKSRT